MVVVPGFSAAAASVPVHVNGLTWTGALVGLLNLLVGGVLVAIVKSRPALKKLTNEREASLLEERAAEMNKMRDRLEKLEAERAVDRHRLNNVTQCLDALLMLLEVAPDKAADHVAKIKQMRASQMTAEAAEKGAIHGAIIAKTGEPV